MVRRWGSGVVHLADVPDSLLYPATVFGSEGVFVDPPVACVCRATLQGAVVKMRVAQVSCRTCRRFEDGGFPP
jgi:hypothetical protein